MLTDLLEISRCDAAGALLGVENRDLRLTALRVIGGCVELAQRQNVSVEIMAQGRVATEIDGRCIERVVRNFVVNAIGHVGGTSVTTTLVATETDVACRVRDRGVGTTQEVADHVFDRFYRADTARVRMTGGINLGLAVAAEDVATHGGRSQMYGGPGRDAPSLMTLPKRAGEEIASRPFALREDE